MKISKVKFIMLIFVIFIILSIPNYSKAADLYLGIREYREGTTPSNIGYAIGNPDANQSTEQSRVGYKIWKIEKYSSLSDTKGNTETSFYCIKAGVGFSDTEKKATYDKTFDLIKDRDAIINTGDATLQSIVGKGTALTNNMSQEKCYWGIIALSDLIYVPESSTEEEKINLLVKAGIGKNTDLTKDDIDAVQQAAYWYFTNYDDTEGEVYTRIFNKYGKENWLNYKRPEEAEINQEYKSYHALKDYDLINRTGERREYQGYMLYDYLIKTALENIPKYQNKSMISKNKITLHTKAGGATIQPVITIEKYKPFDLAIRKYITKVEDTVLKDIGKTREPNIDVSTIATEGTAKYKHRKDPVVVKKGQTITYNITIYNEGVKKGRATKIIDQLPTGLKFKGIKGTEGFKSTYNETTNQVIFTREETNKTNLNAYTEGTLDSETITFECTVEQEASYEKSIVLTNVAWIQEEYNADDDQTITNIEGEDRDSIPEKIPQISGGTPVNKDNMTDYKGTTTEIDLSKNEYYPGQEDDDDFEKIIIERKKKFDLALRKFITKVEKQTIDTRIPQVSYNQENNKITYTHSKEPVDVVTGNTVIYTIRVFNEGEVNGYASKITDDIPKGLEFLPTHATNQTYRWKMYDSNGKETNTITNAVKISTDYLSKEQGEERKGSNAENPALLKAFNPETAISNTNPSYKDVQVAFKVTEPNTSERVIVNSAQISDNTDENGDKIDDNDSTPDEWIEGDDDQDKEYIKVNYFDLALRKFIVAVSKTTDVQESDYIKKTDGKYAREPEYDTTKLNTIGADGKFIKTAIYKHPKNKITVSKKDIVIYMLRVYNEAQISGYATEISDYLPEGLEFVEGEFNTQYKWEYDKETNVAKTTYLKDTIINGIKTDEHGKLELDYKDVPIMCKVKKEAKSETVQTNLAEITGDKNDKNVLDRDSEPNNLEVPSETEKPTYNDDKTGEYVPGQEDDDDFEKIVIEKPKIFDLALRKFITKVEGQEIDTRIPELTYNKASDLITYTHSKEPVEVVTGNTVTYTIRVFNEGEENGYASKVTDDIPKGLEYLPEHETNKEYGWVMYDANGKETNTVANAVKITTEYLSKEQGEARKEENEENPALLKAFDKEAGITDKNPDHKDIQVVFKVKDPNIENKVIINRAQISENTDEDGDNIGDDDSTPDEWIEGDDDQDKEYIKVNYFDLALRKFIIAVSKTPNIQESDYIKNSDGKYTREPQYDTSKLETIENGKDIKTAIYKHTKDRITVSRNDIVIYMLRVYNEAQISGYATEISDYLPEGLEFVEGEFNTEYKWEYDKNTHIAKTTYLKDTIINGVTTNTQGKLELDYKEVPIMCKVKNDAKSESIQTNLAEISEERNDKNVLDRDSEPDNLDVPSETEKPTYNDDKTGEYIPGQEDDDDFEKVVIEKELEPVKRFDLALKKFITKVERKTIDSRIPQASYDKENNKITYTHPKEPVDVVTGNTVIYTIRVFNEGELNGYASKVTDDIPEGLEYLPEHETNEEYRWEMYDANGNKTNKVEDAVKITTDYLSKEQGEARREGNKEENPALLKAFNPNEEITETNPDYKDVQVAFKVQEPKTSDKVIINSAQISENTDENGDEVEDDDSTPDEWKEGEDDQDNEYIKMNYFDLSLKKWVTQTIVIEDGKEIVRQTGNKPEQETEPIVKIEIHRNKLNKVTVKFRFSIRVTNEGDIAGYAKEITDYIPEGLKFVEEDNPGWTDKGNNMVTTNLLADKLLQPGDSQDVEILLTWINGSNNMGLKTNVAEITKDYNDKGAPDRDSTPGNKQVGEDDIDDAPVMLSIKTGKIQTYIILGLTSLIIIAGGITLIKKYVL